MNTFGSIAGEPCAGTGLPPGRDSSCPSRFNFPTSPRPVSGGGCCIPRLDVVGNTLSAWRNAKTLVRYTAPGSYAGSYSVQPTETNITSHAGSNPAALNNFSQAGSLIMQSRDS